MQVLKQALKIANVALYFVLLTGFAKCPNNPDLNLPKGEICTNSIEQTGKLLCNDSRFKPGTEGYEYERFLGQGRNGERVEDIITNSNDYGVFYKDYIETKEKYLVCKKYPKKCK